MPAVFIWRSLTPAQANAINAPPVAIGIQKHNLSILDKIQIYVKNNWMLKIGLVARHQACITSEF
ncbi:MULTISPECIES: hypothetical protein [Nostoc]|uniref:Uncharacterized protein n=1 Tax=Nostoc paludosum FACHB-159 TaxID=2692908 RepID=A0ABR8K9A7_9NOSO|nr:MULTISPECIES: hypothetical protein [Nostoc]MBD2679829.1 hypothetical protein [Nostoc sp. FACHB-857]MBD2736078.1 hypothetical protein [Nostoc paludosum FACHB-159]